MSKDAKILSVLIAALLVTCIAGVVLLVGRQAPVQSPTVGVNTAPDGVFYADAAKDAGTATSSSISAPYGTSVRALATSSSATWRMIQNLGPSSVYLRLGADKGAASSTGILLVSSSTIQLDTTQHNLYRGSIQAVGFGGAATLLVNEY